MPFKVSNGLDVDSQKIINLLDGSATTDAVNYGQLLAAIRGIIGVKDPVRAAVTTNGTLATAYENGDSAGGVTLATGDRLLLAGQTAGETNGIYTVNASGAPTRALDFDSSAEVKGGVTVAVTEGTYADHAFRLTTDDPITLGSTALVFVDLGTTALYTAGDGLLLTGQDFSVRVDSTTIESASDILRIAATAAGSGLTGGGASGALAVNTGTGLEISSDTVRIAAAAAGDGLDGGGGSALAVDSTVARYYSTATHSSGTSIVITHSFGRKSSNFAVRVTSSDERIYPDIVATSTTTTTFTFAVSQSANTLTFEGVG